MGVTRKERLLKAMLSDNAEACRGGVSREERILASVSKKVCDNDALEGGGSGSGGNTGGGMPEGGNPHQMLVTDKNGNAKWEDRTHYKEKRTIFFDYDDGSELNIKNEDGETVLYYVSESSFMPEEYKEIYVEFNDIFGNHCKGIFKHDFIYDGCEVLVLRKPNESWIDEDIYVIDYIEEDSVTIDGFTFHQTGIYAPRKMLFWGAYDPEQVNLSEIMCENYHQLDKKFLPDGAVLPSDRGPNMMLVTDEDGNTKWEERSTTGGGGSGGGCVYYIDATIIDENNNCQLSRSFEEIASLYANKNLLIAHVNMGTSCIDMPVLTAMEYSFVFGTNANGATFALDINSAGESHFQMFIPE